jgi:plasmid stabilization system protein ParE
VKARRPIRWSRLAVHDLEAAHAYLAERNPAAAQRFAATVLRAVESIETHPEIGVVARDLAPLGRFRHLVTGHHRIIYRIEEELIRILRVWDARRNPADLLPE